MWTQNLTNIPIKGGQNPPFFLPELVYDGGVGKNWQDSGGKS